MGASNRRPILSAPTWGVALFLGCSGSLLVLGQTIHSKKDAAGNSHSVQSAIFKQPRAPQATSDQADRSESIRDEKVQLPGTPTPVNSSGAVLPAPTLFAPTPFPWGRNSDVIQIGEGPNRFDSAVSQASATVAPTVSPATATNAPPKQVVDPNTLVLNAIQQAVFGPTFTCKVYQQSFAYGQDVILSGDYKSAGNGTGQFSYRARVSSGEMTIDTIQISDGRLMYSQIDEEPLRIVNVERIRETLAPRLHQIKESPDIAIHLAVGGHAELLRNLYQRYNWHAVAAGTSDNVEVWQLLGRLRTEKPRITGTSKLDDMNLAIQPSDEGLPPGVRLTIGRSASAPYFPYSVEYFRMKKDKDGRPMVPVAVSHIRYIEPTHNIMINESDFVFRSDTFADTAIREDELYLPR